MFNNHASKENSVRIFRLQTQTEELYYELENATDGRCSGSIKDWTRSSIVQEGALEPSRPGNKVTRYCHIPLQH